MLILLMVWIIFHNCSILQGSLYSRSRSADIETMLPVDRGEERRGERPRSKRERERRREREEERDSLSSSDARDASESESPHYHHSGMFASPNTHITHTHITKHTHHQTHTSHTHTSSHTYIIITNQDTSLIRTPH